LKRRIFPSLYVHKNFKKLHKRSLEQTFCQVRADYVERNLLGDTCTPDDVVYLGALILKVRLQSKLLRSKLNKLSQDLILKHIDYAIPSSALDLQGGSTGKGRRPEHWAARMEEHYFKKKEFLECSLEEAQERFLSALGLYSIMFSSYYVVSRDPEGRREADKVSLMQRIAAKRAVQPRSPAGGGSSRSETSRDADDSDDASSSSGVGHGKRPRRRSYE
jgi:hypothetical protein